MGLPILSHPTESHVPSNDVEWTASKSFIAYGTRFGLRTRDLHALNRALEYLPHGWQPIPGGEVDILFSLHLAPGAEQPGATPCHSLYAGSELLARETDDTAVLSAFASHAQLFTAQHARDRLFVHAGVVAYEGRAILIPGHSWSGKSSLVRALVRAGAVYYSDEFALLDRRGWVYPYALPLSLRTVDSKATKISVEQLGGTSATGPAPVALIVVTEYRSRARWRPQVLTSAQGMLALMANTVAAQSAPQLAMTVLRETVMHSRIVQTKRGEARRIAPLLLNLLTQP